MYSWGVMEVFELFQVFYPPLLMNLYVPGFLNIWLVKKSLEKLFVSFDSVVGRFGLQLMGGNDISGGGGWG